jgi:hypothetical protein
MENSLMRERIEITATRDGNAILGNFYRVSAWRGNSYLGERVYAGYSKKDSLRLAREIIRERGELFAS